MPRRQKHQRTPITPKVRFDVFKRDGFVCQYCGGHPPDIILQVDHIVAVTKGGTNGVDNLITSCQPCNIGKGAGDLRIAPQTLAEKADVLAEREAQLQGYQALQEDIRQRVEKEIWIVARELGIVRQNPNALATIYRADFISIKRFVECLGFHAVLDAAEIALGSTSRDSFRYFCGVCWNKIRERK